MYCDRCNFIRSFYSRFLGIGSAIGNLLNPCSRCNIGDQELANRCCQTGHNQCCFALQPTFGGGFNQGGFGGFNQGGFGGFQPGFGSGFGGGFNQGGFNQGGFSQGGFNQGGFNTKPGFCPRQGLFRSGDVNAGPGLRSAAAPGTAAPAAAAPVANAAAAGGNRRVRQTPAANAAPTQNATNPDGTPNTRFLNLFGPGPLINNPFCRDECFRDFDCAGNLKCCVRDCRRCSNPSFF